MFAVVLSTSSQAPSIRKCNSSKPRKSTTTSTLSFPSFPKPYSSHFISVSASSTYPDITAPCQGDDATITNLADLCHRANAPYMKGGFGAFGSGTLTLESAPLDLSELAPSKPSPLLDTGGGDGSEGGNIIGLGGGGGGDGGSDDDEYNWGNVDPDDNGGDDDHGIFDIFRRRRHFPEIFDKEVIDAVLSEWMKTMKDLPLGLQQAYKNGMLSSAQFTRFLWFNARPSVTRALSRVLPASLSRDFSGKMIADPSLPCKLLMEILGGLGFSVWWDYERRGIERMKKEWKLVLVNALTVASCNAFVVWSLAPCYRYGEGFGFKWLNNSLKLPNNVFEKRYLFHGFDLQKRVFSFFYKSVNLFGFGVVARMTQLGLSSTFSSKEKEVKDKRLVLAKMGASAIGAGLFTGLHSNLRYQLLNGMDRGLVGYFDVMGVALFLGSGMRILNAKIGAKSLSWFGDDEDTIEFGNWFGDLKSAVASGVGLTDAFTTQGQLEFKKGRKMKI